MAVRNTAIKGDLILKETSLSIMLKLPGGSCENQYLLREQMKIEQWVPEGLLIRDNQ